MSGITPPRIFPRPGVYNTAVDMWWRAPINSGGHDISGYTLTCVDQTFSPLYFSSTTREAYITGLESYIPYTFQLTATNTNGDTSQAASFNTVIPGPKTSPPIVPSSSITQNGTVTLAWEPPYIGINVGYAITLRPQPSGTTIRASARSADTSVMISTNTAVAYYTCSIQSVNDSGWSDPAIPNQVTVGIQCSMASFNAQITGRTIFSGPTTTPAVSGFANPPRITSTIIIGPDGTLYGIYSAPGIGTNIYAFDTTGTIKPGVWGTNNNGYVYSPAIGSNGRVFAVGGGSSSILYAHDASGAVIDSFDTETAISSSPTIAGTLIIVNSGGTIYSCSTNNLATNTTIAFSTMTSGNQVAYKNGLYVIAGTDSNNSGGPSLAIRLPNSTIQYFLCPDVVVNPYAPIYGQAIIRDDGNVLVYLGLHIYLINPTTATPIWSYRMPDDITTFGSPFTCNYSALGLNNVLYVLMYQNNTTSANRMNSSIYAINPNGTLAWNQATINQVSTSLTIGGNGTLYISSDTYNFNSNSIYALSPAGVQLWAINASPQVPTSISIDSNGDMYVSDYSFTTGTIYRLQTGGTITQSGDTFTITTKPNLTPTSWAWTVDEVAQGSTTDTLTYTPTVTGYYTVVCTVYYSPYAGPYTASYQAFNPGVAIIPMDASTVITTTPLTFTAEPLLAANGPYTYAWSITDGSATNTLGTARVQTVVTSDVSGLTSPYTLNLSLVYDSITYSNNFPGLTS